MTSTKNPFIAVVLYILISLTLPASIYVGTTFVFNRYLSPLAQIAENFFIRPVIYGIKKEITRLQAIPNRTSEEQAKLEQQEHDLMLPQDMQKTIIKEFLTFICLGIIILLLSYRISSAVLNHGLFTGSIFTIVMGLLLLHTYFLSPIQLYFFAPAEIIFALATFITLGYKLVKELK